VLLDVEISDLCIDEFWPEDDPNLDNFIFEGRGGGIKALAEICLYKKGPRYSKFENSLSLSISWYAILQIKTNKITTLTTDLIFLITGHARHTFPRSTRSLLSATNKKI